jgi:hypothetical protein
LAGERQTNARRLVVDRAVVVLIGLVGLGGLARCLVGVDGRLSGLCRVLLLGEVVVRGATIRNLLMLLHCELLLSTGRSTRRLGSSFKLVLLGIDGSGGGGRLARKR